MHPGSELAGERVSNEKIGQAVADKFFALVGERPIEVFGDGHG
jgi:hypothetical protein